jgi:ABC-type nitrate/sulfonate/bicarbonate transport system ATPase subunit
MMAPADDPVLTMRNVSKSFPGRPVLKDWNLDVGEGEILCILGPSGCGKTTLLNLIAGLLVPDAGEIRRPARLGYVFQEPRLLPWRTVRENIAFGLKARGVREEERRQVAGRLIGHMGLEPFADHYPHQLSGGMRQRVALARALAVDPELLLLDEPFKSLDVLLRLELVRLLVEEWRISPRPIIFVTHEVQEAALVAHRVLIMRGSPAQVAGAFTLARSPAERRPEDPDVVHFAAQLYQELLAAAQTRP